MKWREPEVVRFALDGAVKECLGEASAKGGWRKLPGKGEELERVETET